MRRTELLQEIRKMRFEEAYGGWEAGRLTQAEAASLLGVCERTFRRYLARYEESGVEGLIDRRLEQVSHRKAPVDEVMALTEKYRRRHEGWSAKHFSAWYRKDGGTRSYTWVKSRLQEEELIPKAKARGVHRKRRERSPWPGLRINQDGSRHESVPRHQSQPSRQLPAILCSPPRLTLGRFQARYGSSADSRRPDGYCDGGGPFFA